MIYIPPLLQTMAHINHNLFLVLPVPCSVYTTIVALAFAITSLLLFVYDRLVTRRQERTKNAALRVVSSLFPSQVHDKVLRGHYDSTQQKKDDDANVIASFYPNTTVMFADISGFTSWASTRRPEQVFLLLETSEYFNLQRLNDIRSVGEQVGFCRSSLFFVSS